MKQDVYLDKVYKVVDTDDMWKYEVTSDEDFTYIDYYERSGKDSDYIQLEHLSQEIRTDAAILIAKAILELTKKNSIN